MKRVSAREHAQKLMGKHVERKDYLETVNNFFSGEELIQKLNEQQLLEKAQKEISYLTGKMNDQEVTNENTREAWGVVNYLLKEDEQFAREFSGEMLREYEIRQEIYEDSEHQNLDNLEEAERAHYTPPEPDEIPYEGKGSEADD